MTLAVLLTLCAVCCIISGVYASVALVRFLVLLTREK